MHEVRYFSRDIKMRWVQLPRLVSRNSATQSLLCFVIVGIRLKFEFGECFVANDLRQIINDLRLRRPTCRRFSRRAARGALRFYFRRRFRRLRTGGSGNRLHRLLSGAAGRREINFLFFRDCREFAGCTNTRSYTRPSNGAGKMSVSAVHQFRFSYFGGARRTTVIVLRRFLSLL